MLTFINVRGVYMKENVLREIEKNRSEFSKGQKRIADYINNHYDKAAYMTAAKLGEAVNVSESTVVRFATEIGYDGYPGLQKSLLELIPKKLTAQQRMEVAATQMGEDDVLQKVLQADINNIRTTLSWASVETFSSVVDTITSARSIYILGTRSTMALAQFMNFYFNLMLPDVKLIQSSDDAGMYEQMMRIDHHDVFISISFPRYASVMRNAAMYASGRGAKVIAITDSYSAPISEYATYTLVARSNMAAFADSLVAPLSIINALIVAIGIKKKPELDETLSGLEDIWYTYGIYEEEPF